MFAPNCRQIRWAQDDHVWFTKVIVTLLDAGRPTNGRPDHAGTLEESGRSMSPMSKEFDISLRRRV